MSASENIYNYGKLRIDQTYTCTYVHMYMYDESNAPPSTVQVNNRKVNIDKTTDKSLSIHTRICVPFLIGKYLLFEQRTFCE